MHTEVRLFGSPRYRLTGEWRPLPLDKRGALLAMLAHSQEGLSRSRLARLFWPEATPPQGRVNLRGLLARTRYLNPRPELQLLGERLVWHVSCDSRYFREALREERWLDALDVSRAPFMHNLVVPGAEEVTAWLELERRELEAGFALAVGQAADQLARAGDYLRVEGLWLRALERDPYDEAAMGAALRLALRFAPLTGAALRLLERFVEGLQADLLVPAPAELVSLGQQLRQRATGIHHPAEDQPPPAARPGGRRYRLPVPTLPIVRRDAQVDEVVKLLEGEGRHVTIVGPGGIGKTQLALQTARSFSVRSPDGCWFVPLNEIAAEPLLAATVAQAVGVPVQGSAPIQVQLLAYLRHRTALLVLDHLEHLPASGDFIADLLAACPGLRVLATSRSSSVGAPGITFQLGGLPYPDRPDDPNFEEYDAVRLFSLRARQIRPGYTLAEAERPSLLSVFRAVGGAPLGIELAAAWIGGLALDEIAMAFAEGCSDIVMDLHDVPARQRSLRTAFDHSWRLLTDAQRHALASLSVFGGGFTAEAAEHVTAEGPSTLAALLSWSLVRRAGPGRFDLHELIRQFAATELAADPAGHSAARQRHASYFAELVEREGRWFRGGGAQVRALDTVAEELTNVRIAWEHARDSRDAEALERFLPMFHLYEVRGLYEEGAEAFGLSAAVLDTISLVRARSLTAQSVLLGRLGRLQESRSTVDESLAILDELGQIDALTLLHLGIIEHLEGDDEKAEATWRKTVKVAAELGDAWSASAASCNLGLVAWYQGNAETGRRLLLERVADDSELRDRWGDAMAYAALAEIELELGDLRAASDHLAKGSQVAHSIAQQPVLLNLLYLQGRLAGMQGDIDGALTAIKECIKAARESGDSITLGKALEELASLEQESSAGGLVAP